MIMAFATYLYALTGSWTAWYRAQTTGWVRELTWPWQSFLNTIFRHTAWRLRQSSGGGGFRGEMISMAVGVGVTVWCIVVSLRARNTPNGPDRPMWGEELGRRADTRLFHVLLVLLGQPRHLLWFPLWIMLGRWVAGPTRLSPPAHRLLVGAAFLSKLCSCVVELVVLTGHWAS